MVVYQLGCLRAASPPRPQSHWHCFGVLRLGYIDWTSSECLKPRTKRTGNRPGKCQLIMMWPHMCFNVPPKMVCTALLEIVAFRHTWSKIHTRTSRTTAFGCSIHTLRLAHMSNYFSPCGHAAGFFPCRPAVRVKTHHITVVLCGKTLARNGRRHLFGRMLQRHPPWRDRHADAQHRHLEMQRITFHCRAPLWWDPPTTAPAHLLRHEAPFVRRQSTTLGGAELRPPVHGHGGVCCCLGCDCSVGGEHTSNNANCPSHCFS